jgi:raffinose/stachyose/melibiose transport system substrate-binding protein
MLRARRAVSRRDFLRLGGVGLAGAALLGVAGCGGNEGAQGGKVVRFFTGSEETTALEKAAEELVAKFEEKHPNITVEREAVPTEDQRSVIQTRLQSGTPPDVFSYDTGPGFGGVLAEAGLLRPLEDAYKKYDWNIYDWAKQRATYGGKVYGVPEQVEEVIVYYNKDLVPEAPQTVDELRQIADELKGRDIIPFAFGDQEQWPAGHLFSIGASNMLGREGLDDILYGDGRWDTPEVVTAIELFFRDFVESGYYPDGVNAITYDDANSLFFSGRAGMLPTGTWLVSTIVETVQDFEVDFFPFPSIDGSSISPPAGVGSGLFVAANAKNPEGALTFIDYLQSDEAARFGIEKFNTIPAFPIDTQGLDVPELFRQVLDDLSQSPQAEAFGYNIDVLAPQNFNEVMFSGFQEVINGSRSPEEQAAALQKAWAKAKKAGNAPTQAGEKPREE